MKKTLTSFCVFLLFTCISAQKGVIVGKVIDKVTGETLLGVSVNVKGSSLSTITDLDGKYRLEVEAGTYDLQANMITFNTSIATGVVVKKGQIVTIDFLMEEQMVNIGEAVVETKVNKESNSALILEQRTSVTLFDGISAESIRKTPDRTSADVLKRVSGATIQDNSFVIIRGLPDRYNVAYLNSAPLPSSEPDRRAFAFDIFPSALLNDIKVIKTAMPSLTGEFAGGIIQIRTKDIPDKTYYQFSVGTSFNLITTFRDFTKGQGGKTDFLGLDDGTRALPDGIPSNEDFKKIQNGGDKNQLVEFAKMFPNTWGTSSFSAPPTLNLQFSMGHNANLVPKAKRDNTSRKLELGSVLGLTYNNNYTFRLFERNDYDQITRDVHYKDSSYTMNVNWGALWNLAFLHSNRKGANNRISLKNIFNVNSYDQYIYRNGYVQNQGNQVRSHSFMYTQNKLFSTQLVGEHVLPKTKIKFEWSGGYSFLQRDIPDLKWLEYKRPLADSLNPNSPFSIPFSANAQPTTAGRFFSSQTDHIYSGSFDASFPFKLGPTRMEVKSGVYLQYKDRDFDARQFGYAVFQTSQFNSSISTSDKDTLFDDRHLGGPDGLLIKEATNQSDSYQFESGLVAAYVQMENTFFENKLRLVYGVRIENYRQVLNTFKVGSPDPFRLDTTVTDFLPSVNVIWGIHPKINLRASYSQTVARPEARELAPFSFYDYSNFCLVEGSSDLQRTKINNADLRLEWFPKGGQVISVTGFFKHFSDPIEKVLTPAGSLRLLTYRNVNEAFLAGGELELRFSIASFMKNNTSRFLENLYILGNFSYIWSEVNLDSVSGINERRPMQGQSPFIINGGLQYFDTKYNFGVSMAANYIGERIVSVGNVDYPAIWERPRVVLDLQLSKSFLKDKLELKLNFRDLLAQNIILFQDLDKNRKYDASVDNLMQSQNFGQQISFTITGKF